MVHMGRWYLWTSRNTAMQIRILPIAATLLVALSPLAANAGPESAALKTCTAAFASSLASKGAESPSVKLNYRSSQPGSPFAEYYTRDYTFFLKANDPKTGASLARATCSATIGGTLLSLSATPLGTDTATLAARL
jgi:hypothetical protein